MTGDCTQHRTELTALVTGERDPETQRMPRGQVEGVEEVLEEAGEEERLAVLKETMGFV